MPHYYFHLRDGTGGVSDPEGIELPDLKAARDHAAAVAGELMHQVEVKTRHWRLDVSDREGNLLFDLPFVQVDQPSAISLPRPDAWSSVSAFK